LLSQQERSLRARAAAYARAAKYDGREVTAKARSAAWQKYLDEVDPDGSLPEPERKRRAESLRKSRLLAASLKAAVGRRRKAA
jgi:hypothetical protein